MSGNNKILIADDDPVSVELLQRFLIREGYQVDITLDGQSCLDKLKKEKQQLLISDMLMPGIPGLDLCRLVKNDPELKNTLVILMTAVYRDNRYHAEITGSGADDFFTKPYDLAEVLEKIHRLLPPQGAPLNFNPADDAEVDALKNEFLTTLPAKVGDIETRWRAIRHASNPMEAAKRMHLNVRRLAGASQNFDIPRFTKVAQKVSTFLEKTITAGILFEPENTQRMDKAVLALQHVIPSVEGVEELLMDQSKGPPNRQHPLVFLAGQEEAGWSRVSDQLSFFGYEVALFNRLQELKETLSKNPPDVLIADMDLLSGLKSSLKNDPALKDVPLLVGAAQDDFKTRIAALRIGGDAFFHKAASIEKLLAMLEKEICRKPDNTADLLVFHENDADLARIQEQLQPSKFKIRAVNSADALALNLDGYVPDLILIDGIPSGLNLLELVRLLRQYEPYTVIPIMVLVSDTYTSIQTMLQREGVDHLLSRKAAAATLPAEVEAKVHRFRALRAHLDVL